jgi:signal transduction histidine kinase
MRYKIVDDYDTLQKKYNELQKHLLKSENMASLGSLVAGVTHELSTPLSLGITGMSHFISETNKLRELFNNEKMTQEDFENYLNESEKIADIVYTNLIGAKNIIQSFKRVSVDQSSEAKREFILKDYIDEIITSLHNKIKHTNITIKNQIDSNIQLNSYAGSFAQIFTNFIINSLMHGFTTDEHGTITISAIQNDKTIDITYKDNGSGIAEDIIGRIYEPFFTTKGDSGGSGLGLQIIYDLITNKLQGTIDVNSSLGNGTTFNIKIHKELS